MIKLIVFDWDDVFTKGAREGYFKCYRKALEELRVILDPKEERKRIVKKWGQPYKEVLRYLFKENPDLLNKACDIFAQHRFGDTFYSSLSLFPGVNDLLVRLKDKYVLAVATGSHPTAIKKQIAIFKIPDVFSQIVTSHDIDDPTKTKPHPLMLQMILDKQKINPEEAILVGDGENDVLMAKNAGVEPVVVLTGHLNEKQAKQLKVKYIIKDVTDLEKVLKEIQ